MRRTFPDFRLKSFHLSLPVSARPGLSTDHCLIGDWMPGPEEKGETISIENPERSGAFTSIHDVTRTESTGQAGNRIAEEKICSIREFQKCFHFLLSLFTFILISRLLTQRGNVTVLGYIELETGTQNETLNFIGWTCKLVSHYEKKFTIKRCCRIHHWLFCYNTNILSKMFLQCLFNRVLFFIVV